MEEETKIFPSASFSGVNSCFKMSSKNYERLQDVSHGGVSRRKLYKCNGKKTYDNNKALKSMNHGI